MQFAFIFQNAMYFICDQKLSYCTMIWSWSWLMFAETVLDLVVATGINVKVSRFWQLSPSHSLVHWHTLGAVHIPPFRHEGLHTAGWLEQWCTHITIAAGSVHNNRYLSGSRTQSNPRHTDRLILHMSLHSGKLVHIWEQVAELLLLLVVLVEV